MLSLLLLLPFFLSDVLFLMKVLAVRVCVCFLPIHSGHQVQYVFPMFFFTSSALWLIIKNMVLLMTNML